MVLKPEKPKPERAQTDESLRSERRRTDHALAAQKVAAEQEAAEVVAHAREVADEVLTAARDEADERLETTAAPVAVLETVADERAQEDDALRAERATADESLRRERAESARALARLLPLERDQTDRFLLTERARSDDSLSNRDDFLGIVAHDLRDLLGGIVMSAGILAKTSADAIDGPRVVAATDRIQRYAARMNRLIGDLVDVATIDAGKLTVRPAEGDASQLADEVVDMFQAPAQAKGMTLVAQAPGPLPGRFDHDRVLQVLVNLVANAVKFTPAGGTVTVSAETDEDALRFAVSDTGPGIPADMLLAVFDRFRQLRTDDARGLGLGLHIAKCLVEAHGGTIAAESAPGAGSTFRFSLPATKIA